LPPVESAMNASYVIVEPGRDKKGIDARRGSTGLSSITEPGWNDCVKTRGTRS